jgi:hypothetical protein
VLRLAVDVRRKLIMSSVFSALKGWRDVKDGKNWRTAGAAQRTKLRNEANNPFDEPRMDVLPRSAGTATTQSTFLKGPGMGVAAEWVIPPPLRSQDSGPNLILL